MRSSDLGAASGSSRNARPMFLSDLSVGCSACVRAVGGERELRRRLLEMGLCNGAKVECVRRAPWGDPIEYRIRGYHLSLRGEQARCVSIDVQQTESS
jgi:Fe2+ transport system protein FeoA